VGKLDVGVKAVGTNPIKSGKSHPGERDVPVAFAGVKFMPGEYVYADADGIVVSKQAIA
jgi:regulator of ribonuclease activity A